MGKPFNYGGQAVIEGVMMRGQKFMTLAVRNPKDEIVLHVEPLNPRIYSSFINKVPFVRGTTLLWDALVLGIRTLMLSADIAMGEEEGEKMDKCLILHAEHGMNASTFTARVVASTLSTCYCSIAAAIGSLYGSLHGGANEKVVGMLEEIGSIENVKPFMEKALAEKRKIMGMGHRVYRAKDPRSVIMEGYLKRLSEKQNDFKHYHMLKEIESEFRKSMDEKGKELYPNVDFFSGSVYDLLGIPSSLFTPIFAIARVSGWLSHILEQRQDNRIYRPKAVFVGQIEKPFIKISDR